MTTEIDKDLIYEPGWQSDDGVYWMHSYFDSEGRLIVTAEVEINEFLERERR